MQFKENPQTDGWKDRRTDRPYFIGPFSYRWGSQNILSDSSKFKKLEIDENE